jgi:pectate lyase
MFGVLTPVFNVKSINASSSYPPIYIRADGSIDPPTAPIERDGSTYTLTGNITRDTDGIVIERDNMTLDGAGHTVQGPGAGVSDFKGIEMTERSNITIKNLEINGFNTGIQVDNSSRITISRNKITTNFFCILFLHFFKLHHIWKQHRGFNKRLGWHLFRCVFIQHYIRKQHSCQRLGRNRAVELRP